MPILANLRDWETELEPKVKARVNVEVDRMVAENDKSEVPSTPVLVKPNELEIRASFTKL